ncbi:MAG: GMC family oxidoreductase [Pseudomonadota bacterium]
MLLDLDSTEGHRALEADICIAGAGAAGVTLARALAAEGVEVLLLESGGRDFQNTAQDLAAGEVAAEGEPYYPLRESRLRFFGGTTAIWGGRVAELDPVDFEPRPGIANSGWPITHADLVPWYAAAHAALGLTRIASPAEGWRRLGRAEPPLDPGVLEPGFWQFDGEADRFTLPRAADLVAAPNVTVVLNATVTEIALQPGGRAVAGFDLRSPKGARATARGRHFVLATGGIEAPRLVLASRLSAGGDPAHGFGGEAVGRYFIEHPHARGGRLRPAAGWGASWRALSLLPRHARHDGVRHAAVLRPSATVQRREGILNSALGLALRRPEGSGAGMARRGYAVLRHTLPSTGGWRRAWRLSRRAAATWRRLADPVLSNLATTLGGREIALSIRAEQAPNPASRVTLSPGTHDSLGVPLPVLDWRLSGIDRQSVQRLVALFGEECARLDVGRVEPAAWLAPEDGPWQFDPAIGNHALGGYHHMGTLRMGTDPQQSVVDADCRFHDLANLHVAGSAVFPTGGWANPTLTILALALRLGARLAQLVGHERLDHRQTAQPPEPRVAVAARRTDKGRQEAWSET